MSIPNGNCSRIFLLLTLSWNVSSCFGFFANENSRELEKQLGQRVTVLWEGQSLAGALSRISKSYRLSVWLDRRVDPNQLIGMNLRGESLRSVFDKIAENCELSVGLIGGVVYLGPQDAAGDLMATRENLHGMISDLPLAKRAYWKEESSLTWPRLSEPRGILGNLFLGGPCPLGGVGRVPFDLWNKRQLPMMSRVDQALLLLIGFDLSLQIESSGNACMVVPVQRPVLFTRYYPARRNSWSSLGRLRKEFPELEIEFLRSQNPASIRVTGSWLAQEKLRQELVGRTSGAKKQSSRSSHSSAPARQAYSLEIREQKARNVLQQLAKQLPVNLIWDEQKLSQAGYSLDTRISCSVESVSMVQLLEAILKPIGLQAYGDGPSREILPLRK